MTSPNPRMAPKAKAAAAAAISTSVMTFGSGDCNQLGLGTEIFSRKKPALLDELEGKSVCKVRRAGDHWNMDPGVAPSP